MTSSGERLLLELPSESHATVIKKGGVLAGTQVQPREVIDGLYKAGFRNDALVVAAMVCGGESWHYTRAYNDNPDGSRDVGLMQINIPKSAIGTVREEDLYMPSFNFNVAFQMWRERQFQPWVSYNTNTYLHDTYRAWAFLGLVNHYAEFFDGIAKEAGVMTQLKVPLITTHQLKVLYPNVVLG